MSSDRPSPPSNRNVGGKAGRTIGTVASPGDGPAEFEFIAPGSESIRSGEFIVYETNVEGDRRAVLSRVTDTTQERGLPGDFLADPEIDPDAVAGALGVPTNDPELNRYTARTIGYFDETMETFTNPRSQPDTGTKLRVAAHDFLEATLPAADWKSDSGTAYLGWLLNRPTGAANLHLPIDDIAATHLALLARTGSGKSYTASVLIEEMMRPSSRAALLVLDPHGEYDTLSEMRFDEHADIFEGTDGYWPEVNVVRPENISIAIPDLSFGDLIALLDDPSEKMRYVLGEAWRELQADSNHISVDDITAKCYEIDGEDSSTANGIAWRLGRVLGRDLFAPAARKELTDLVSPGQVTVLNLDRLSESDEQLLAAALLRKLYEAREAAVRGTDDALDYPVFTLLEEGHRFAPNGQARSLGIIQQILSEGRKFGFGIGIISQRPSKIDPDVLSQCGTQVIMQIKNPEDQKAIRQSIESAGEDILMELPSLTPGQAVVAGDAMNTPALLRVRERYTTHGATSPDATLEWRDAYGRRQDGPNGVRDAYDESEDVNETSL